MRKLVLGAAVAALCACGPSSSSTSSSMSMNDMGAMGRTMGPTALSSDLAGTWNVATFISVGGAMVANGQGELVVSVSGATANFADLCPDHSGAVSASGSGDVVEWGTTLACPETAITTCASLAITYTSGMARVSDSVLTVIAKGTGTGCGVTDQVSTAFTSSNQ